MDTDIRRAASSRATGVAASLSAAELGVWKRDRLAELRALIHSLRADGRDHSLRADGRDHSLRDDSSRAECDATPQRVTDLRVTS